MVLNKQGGRGFTRIAEVLLGDATGVIVFSAKNEQVDILAPGKYAVLRNARVDMFKGSMRLVVDQWGKVEPAEDGSAFEPKVCCNAMRVECVVVPKNHLALPGGQQPVLGRV